MRDRLIKGLILICALAVSLLAAEVVARALTHFPIHSPAANLTFDDRLLYRVDPGVDGIDANGFRNPESYAHDFPKIAAIGDSFTLGYNVESEESWPSVLGDTIGQPVYNFGVGSYGLLQYVELVRLAAEMGAKKVIVAFATINDLSVCNVVRLKYWQDELFADPSAREQLKAYCSLDDGELGQTPNEIIVRKYRGVKRWLESNSALYSMWKHAQGLVRARRDVFARNPSADYSQLTAATENCSRPESDFIFEAYGSKDFVPDLYGENGYLPYFRDQVTSEFASAFLQLALDRIGSTAQEYGIEVYFLIIPTEARVITNYLSQAGEAPPLPPWVDEVAAAEAAHIAVLMQTLAERGFNAVDATGETVEAYGRALRAGKSFFPCRDSHPLRAGYRAYAKAASELIKPQ